MGIVTAGGAIGQGVTPLLRPADDQRIRLAHDMRFACRRILVVLAPIMLLVRKPDGWPQRRRPRLSRSRLRCRLR